MVLSLNGELFDLGKEFVGGLFIGILEWQLVKVYIIGMCNLYGLGMIIVVVIIVENFNDKYQ